MAYDAPTLLNPQGGGTWLFAQLPVGNAAVTLRVGTTAWTSDQQLVTWDGVAWRGGVVTRKVISQMRACLAAAASANEITAQPWIAPIAWAATTLWYKGQACVNGGNVYVCIVQGITAGSGGPTGVGSAQIVDGAASWYYWGPTFSTDPNAPTVTSTGTRYNTGASFTNTAATGGLGAQNIKDSTNFILTPGTDGGGANGAYLWNAGGVMGSATFVVDAPAFQIALGATANPGMTIYINGRPLTAGVSITNPSVNAYTQIIFADRRERLVTVEMPTTSINTFIGVLTIDTTSKVWAPSNANSYRLAITGTSYIQGTGSFPTTPSLGIGPQLAKRLGVNYNYWVDGQCTGTGYVTPGALTICGSPTRIANMAANGVPDVIIISGGGINDINAASIIAAGATTPAALAIEQAAVLTALQNYRAAFPSALIFVFGSEAGSTGPSAAILNMELAVSNAVAQFADQNCFYLPQSGPTAAKSMISGTGTTVATNGSGNSDVYVFSDGIHVVQAGADYLAYRDAIAIANVVNSLTL